MIALRFAFATIFALVFLAPIQVAAQTLPSPYLGVWQNMEGKAESCSSADWNGPKHSDTHIRVSPKEIEFHEGKCRFTSAKSTEFGDARLSLACASEGTKFRSSEIWALREIRGHRMLITTKTDRLEGATIVYQHCPSQ